MIADELDVLVDDDVVSLFPKRFALRHGVVIEVRFFPDAKALLADRFHVSYVLWAEAFGEMRYEGEAHGGFAHVLLGGRDVNGALVADCGWLRCRR